MSESVSSDGTSIDRTADQVALKVPSQTPALAHSTSPYCQPRPTVLTEESVESVIYRLNRPSLFVGSQAWKVDICLRGENVAEVHGELTILESEVRVSALDNEPITLRGTEIREGIINIDDEVGFGSCHLRLTTLDGMRILVPVMRPHAASALHDTTPEVSNIASVIRGSDRLGKPPIEGPTVLRLPEQAILETFESERTVTCVEAPKPKSQVTFKQPEVHRPVDSHAAPVRQFFIIHAGLETGPIPADAVQQLVNTGTLTDESPIRSENDDHWQTCVDHGFALPSDNSSVDAKLVDGTDKAETDQVAASLTEPRRKHTPSDRVNHGPSRISRFLAMVPLIIFQIVSVRLPAVRTLNLRMVLAGVVIVLAGFGISHVLEARSHRALSGRITFSSLPVEGVIVTLASNETGQRAAGHSDKDGRFVIYTRSGDLLPGSYRVQILATQPEQNSNSLPKHVSEAILAASTTTILTTVSPNQSEVVIKLSDHSDSGPGTLARVNRPGN